MAGCRLIDCMEQNIYLEQKNDTEGGGQQLYQGGHAPHPPGGSPGYTCHVQSQGASQSQGSPRW